jgi:hypothetical protein
MIKIDLEQEAKLKTSSAGPPGKEPANKQNLQGSVIEKDKEPLKRSISILTPSQKVLLKNKSKWIKDKWYELMK